MGITLGFVALHFFLVFFLSHYIFQRLPLTALKRYFIPGLFVKLAAGIVYGIVFQYHYGFGDTFNYFYDGLFLAEWAKDAPLAYLNGLLTNQFPDTIKHSLLFSHQPRALFLSKIASFILLLCGGNYWICAVYFSFFSFLGLFYLANACTQRWPTKAQYAAIAFLFFPSVVFWSAGLNKESIVVGCMGFLIGMFVKYYFGFARLHWHHLIIVTIGAYIIWTLKYYYAALLFPLMFSLLFVSYTNSYFKNKNARWLQLGLWGVSFSLLLLLGSQLHPILHIDSFFQNLFHQHNAIVALSEPRGFIQFNALAPNTGSFISNIPLALFSGLFRPNILDAQNLFQWLTAVENLALLVFCMGSLWNIRKLTGRKDQWLLGATVVYIVILATVLAFAAPNFGALVRYKMGFLPFLVFIVMLDNPLLKKLLK